LSVTGATDDFAPVMGSQATFNLAIRWTGSGSSVTLLDVLPGAGGPAWTSPIVGANGFATGTFFSLKSVTFDEDSLTLIGMGTTQLTSGDPLVQKHSPARIVIQGTGQDFTYNLTVVTTAVPEGGSGIGLFAIGLVGLVAVEGLRRRRRSSNILRSST
jgi:MYXO-CTERM domain-containing protein